MLSAGSYFHAQNRNSAIRNQTSMDGESFLVNLWNSSLSGKCWGSHHTKFQILIMFNTSVFFLYLQDDLAVFCSYSFPYNSKGGSAVG